jgi:hypothetical protein
MVKVSVKRNSLDITTLVFFADMVGIPIRMINTPFSCVGLLSDQLLTWSRTTVHTMLVECDVLFPFSIYLPPLT